MSVPQSFLEREHDFVSNIRLIEITMPSVQDAGTDIGTIEWKLSKDESDAAVDSFCKFIRFPTVSATAPKTGAYKECAKYIVEQLQSIPCLCDIHLLPEAPDHSPVVVACWKGLDESLPIILLNSHYDVVPALKEDWTVEPFDGVKKDGKIYGRGAQDMKCV